VLPKVDCFQFMSRLSAILCLMNGVIVLTGGIGQQTAQNVEHNIGEGCRPAVSSHFNRFNLSVCDSMRP
jgi:hypothetical protein